MASTPETELKPISKEAPVKKGKPLQKKAQSVMVTFKNVHNDDLEVGGFLIKSGTSKKFMTHIGNAISKTPAVSNYIRLKWLVVS